MSRAIVCTVGDAVLDVIVEPTATPVPDDDVPGRISFTGGGQAANVAAWCVALGTAAAVVSRIGSDVAGTLVRSMLAERGVALLGPPPGPTTGVIVSTVTADGKRTMVSDRGAAAGISASEIDVDWLEGCEWLHVSGYALFGKVRKVGQGGGEAALALAAAARQRGARVSVDLSAVTVMASLGLDEARRRLLGTDPDVVFANEAEQRAMGTLDVPLVVVKRGAAGCLVVGNGRSLELGALPGVVRDTTGAGDAFAAGWIVGGPELALLAAQACIAECGAMPPPGFTAPARSPSDD